jgi:hypothetical protein
MRRYEKITFERTHRNRSTCDLVQASKRCPSMSMLIPRENRKRNSQGTYEFLDGCMAIHIIFIAELHVGTKEPIRKKRAK